MLPQVLAFVLCLTPPAPLPHGEEGSFPVHFEAVELAGELTKPVDLVFLPDGTFFIAGKRGEVRYHDGTSYQALPVLDIEDEVVHTGDRGLLGLALQPGYTPDGGANSWLYVLYVVSPVPGADPFFDEDDKYAFSRLTRYRTVTNGADIVADVASREILIGAQLPDGSVPDGIASISSTHAIGTLLFGTDGSLLLTAGDGAHPDVMDPGGLDAGAFVNVVHPVSGLKGPIAVDQDCGSFRSQDLRSLCGKVLRIDPETGLGLPSNPFYNGDPSSTASKVWALGLRNPYRAKLVPGTGQLDPGLGEPGTLLIGDVGWRDWEELQFCSGGENFGWPCFEGVQPQPEYADHEYTQNPLNFPDCDNLGPGLLTGPLVTWDHSSPGALFPPGVHVDEHGVPQGGITGNCAIAGARYPGGDYPAEYVDRFFFADYADDWLRTLVLDAQGGVAEIADFGFAVDFLVDIESHPITGDIHYVALGPTLTSGHVFRVRYGFNLTPTAQLTATPSFGDLPLTVSFDASASDDPENDPLTYEWDFGDNSPLASGVVVQHTYVTDGLYTAVLTVTDNGGLADTQAVQVAAGAVPPVARILSPPPGLTYVDNQVLDLDGTGTDFAGGALSYDWTIDLFHDTHIHPGFVTLPGQTTTYPVEPHGDADDLHYLRVDLTVRNAAGLEGHDHVFLYPAENVVDPTGTAIPITRMQELVPPFPLGTGNLDPEVLRDTDVPPVGSSDRKRQYDTFHAGDQGDDDWIGYEWADTPGNAVQFTALIFQEGLHYAGGGWFDDLTVEVRESGVWEEVEDLEVLPAYPFELSGVPGFDGTSFETYALHFDPKHGDAIRLRGDPGGVQGFLSAGELRVRWATPIDLDDPWRDVTAGGDVVSKLGELIPPFPLGQGNTDPDVIHNGTWPPVGSASLFAQVDSFHNGDQGAEDWIGYAFAEWQTFERVLFQEGFHYPTGGWFDDLDVETRAEEGGAWSPVTGLTVTPQLPGDTSSFGTYETFELTFDPVVARAIRVVGTPGGTDGFISIGELRVYGPAFDEESCGWLPFGQGAGGTNVMTLSSSTPALLGYPAVVTVEGAPGAGAGALLLAASSFSLPAFGGTVLVNPFGATLLPINFDLAGASVAAGALPSDPSLVGQSFYLQALVADGGQPGLLFFSNGLELALCP